MNHPTLADIKTCTGCLACVDVCPVNALSGQYNEEGHLTYKCDTNKCILCHQCERTCPVVSNFPYRTDNKSEFYAAWCKDDDLRKHSSSGGVFAAMAQYIIGLGGYVVGASNEGVCNIKQIVINKQSEIAKLQGSKYTQSNAISSFKQTLALLKEGKCVLYSGTGCQVAGLLSYLKKRKYTGKLITVDLICGGVPSRLLIDKFLENEPYRIKKILSFRTKENGWKSKGFIYNMLVEDENGKIHDYTGVHNLVTDGFSSELTDRYSCYDCQFNGVSRASDFTIGDLWGDESHKDQHAKGVSLVIAHNEQAVAFLKEIEEILYTEPTDKDRAIQFNHRIVNGRNPYRYLIERRYLSLFFQKLSYKTLKRLYGNDYSWNSPWILYKIVRKVIKIILKRI